MSNDISDLTVRQQTTQRLLNEAEKESAERVAAAQKRAKAAEAEEQKKLDEIKDQYVRLRDEEAIRQDVALQAVRQKGYENIRENRRQSQDEVTRVQKEGEKNLSLATEHYQGAIAQKQHQGEMELEEVQRRSAIATEAAHAAEQANAKVANQDHSERMKGLIERHQQQVNDLHAQSQQQLDRVRTSLQETSAASEQRLRATFEQNQKKQQASLSAQDARAAQALDALRADQTHQLSTYQTRSADPFYQLVSLGIRMQETDDAFIVTANVPEHERRNVTVTIRGNELVIAGQRHNRESQEIAPGQKQSTASYQSYSESVPLSFPVDARGIRREFEGDQLVVRVPKKTTYEAAAPQFKKKDVGRMQQIRPNFPEHMVANEPAGSDGAPVQPPSKGRAGRPISES